MGKIEEVVRGVALSASRDHLRIVCPECSHKRRIPAHRREPTLSITIKPDTALWTCHHCGSAGGVRIGERHVVMAAVPQSVPQTELSPEAFAWLQSRGLTADNPGVKMLRMINGGIAFPYYNEGHAYAWKIRSISQKMFWCQGSPQTFFGACDKGQIVITEGEIDALSFMQAGIGAWSAPNGAPSGAVMNGDDRRLRCLEPAKDAIEKATKAFIATDNDGPGDALAEELARRIGKHKCWRVRYPDGCKDANDVLVKHGASAIAQLINGAEPWPISGLHSATEFSEKIEELYLRGMPRGKGTGWGNLDEYLSIKPGLLYIVTGVPAAGKSTWLDALLLNLAVNHQWKAAVASFETQPIEVHVAKLCAAHRGKPFAERPHRMTPDEMHASVSFVNNHFLFCSLGELPTIQSILDRFKSAVLRQGVRICVVDPFNYIRFPEHAKDGIDTEAVNKMLNEFKQFATTHDVAFFLVAHPAKPQVVSEDWVPKGYAISGSAHWYNRADFGITIHRGRSDLSEVHVWKVRFNHLGKQGVAHLVHDVNTGRYVPAPQSMIMEADFF